MAAESFVFPGVRARRRAGVATMAVVALWLGVLASPAGAKPEPVDPPESVQPARALDTRSGATPAPGSVTNVQIGGLYGVPLDAAAVIINVTAVDVGGPGYFTVWPTGESYPPTSSVNYSVDGLTIANALIVPLGVGGQISIYTYNYADILVDVMGYFPADSAFAEVPMYRALDTRQGGTRPGPFEQVDVPVGSTPGAPPNAAFAVLTVAIVDSSAWGYATVWQTGMPVPPTSSVNVDGPNQTRAGLVVVPLGTDGKISLFSSMSADLIVDVVGFITANSGFRGVSGRLLDTRPGEVAAGSTTTLKVAGVGAVPATAKSVLLNLTSTNTLGWNFLTVYPTGAPQPNASNLNVIDVGTTIANAVWVPVGADGSVNIFSYASTAVIVDIMGYST